MSTASRAAALLFVVVGLIGCQTARVIVTPARPDARATVTAEGGQVVIDVESPGGIGSAQVAVTGGDYPRAIMLRLHLAGLEGFGLEHGGVAFRASVSSGTEHEVRQEADPGSPEFLDVRRGPGVFLIAVPPALLAAAPRSFAFSWIDFYR